MSVLLRLPAAKRYFTSFTLLRHLCGTYPVASEKFFVGHVGHFLLHSFGTRNKAVLKAWDNGRRNLCCQHWKRTLFVRSRAGREEMNPLGNGSFCEKQTPFLSAQIQCSGTIADQLTEALMCFGANSISIEDAGSEELVEQSCITAIFTADQDVGECLAFAADSIGLKEIPKYKIIKSECYNWVQQVQDMFQPTQVTDGLWVIPEWRAPPDPQAINIILDPGVAFGTGEHPTTRLCLLFLREFVNGGDHVLDYGTGSGILSIAALKELLPIFNVHGKVSSIVFENERRDTAIIRYEAEPGEGDQLVGRIRESLHNTQLGDRTLLIEAFRSDSLLFIGNLTPDIDDAVLRKMFEPHGSIERAFVLHNAAGHSKGYGFVEYSLKSQAMAAKVAMGNINMDGRVLRVEWSDCKRIADMFSTVLFVDRIPKDHPNIEGSLRSLFGRYGKVRDCHLAIGINNLYRGFGFIDFYHSICADIAHESLDGHELEGHSIRVSFANPSKSAQSYKVRFGSQGSSGAFSHAGRGGFSGMMINSSMRGHMPMPLLGHRFMGPGRSGMLGMGIGMQFGRGPHVGQALIDQGIVGSGAGMLGAGAAAPGMMGRAPVLNSVPPRRGMAVGGTLAPLPRFPGQGPVPINPATIAQVATAQAKAREEEAKARAEEYHQQQPQQAADNLFKHSDAQYGYQQPYQQQTQQQSTLQPQYQQPAASQMQQSYTQYYAQPAQSYVQPQQQQQPQQGQYSQSSYYQQQPAQQEQAMPSQPYAYAQQYGQQYGQQYAQPGQQQYGQTYNPPAVQNSAQPYQQSAQTQVQTQYAQPAYTDHYTQQQQTQERQPQANPVAPATNAAGILPSQSQDGTQQQAYTSYYNQQAQQNVPQVATVAAQNSTAVGTSQQSLEAQWAAYYASQAAYQQQASYAQQQQPSLAASATSYHEQSAGTPDVGQKRTADQMEAGSQNQQMAYNYPQQTAGYPQQAATGAGTYQQQQPMPATAYQQHPPAAVPGYQMQTSALPYQQQPSATGYQKPGSAAVSSGYDKHVVPVADGYQQQQPAAVVAAFQPTAHGQLAAPIYDYSKRPRF